MGMATISPSKGSVSTPATDSAAVSVTSLASSAATSRRAVAARPMARKVERRVARSKAGASTPCSHVVYCIVQHTISILSHPHIVQCTVSCSLFPMFLSSSFPHGFNSYSMIVAHHAKICITSPYITLTMAFATMLQLNLEHSVLVLQVVACWDGVDMNKWNDGKMEQKRLK